MKSLSVKQVRDQLRQVLDAAESGQTTIITRRGKPVAVISPTAADSVPFPDLSAFRANLKPRGQTLSQTLLKLRREERG
ncbi:MAG: type II toxin-antitoxin system Phd/YefM family antitoxin [Phycisphaerales bacterium]|nr:type II toxin-antitoxin system Phd/YefM family antitoxin [Phycisphaerales bacterium]